MTDTIFALSSGSPPAAIAIVRLSGLHSFAALESLSGRVPPPRRATVATLRDRDGGVLDEALVLAFPGPASATGEDCVELHCHGGRAVVAAICAALASMPGLRAAEAGEFTRRALANGRVDLAQAEALGDLLTAETELQRQVAQAGVGGWLSRQVEEWRCELLTLAAMVEAALDFADEDDADTLPPEFAARLSDLRCAIGATLERPRAERLRDGIRVVLGGPPNSGKSSLFNALLRDNAAIVSPTAGTTRDVIERPVAIEGIPMVLVDTAGVRDEGDDAIEMAGIVRAHEQMARADLVLWLGPEGEGPDGVIEVQSQADDPTVKSKASPHYSVSSVTGEGLAALQDALVNRAREWLPKPGDPAVNARQADLLTAAYGALDVTDDSDLLITAEALRITRENFDQIVGRSGVEDMLDVLFSRFCIGK